MLDVVLSHGVVGEGPVEGLDEFGSGEVPDAVAGFDGGDAERDQDVRLAGAGRADQAGVLRAWRMEYRSRRGASPSGELRLNRAAVRAWARDAGLTISDRGRISAEVMSKYQAGR